MLPDVSLISPPAYIVNRMLNFSKCFFKADFAPDELEVGVREHILLDLEAFVRRQFAGELEPFRVQRHRVFSGAIQPKRIRDFRYMSPGNHDHNVRARVHVNSVADAWCLWMNRSSAAAVWILQKRLWLQAE